MVYVGLFFLVFAGILFFVKRSEEEKLGYIKAIETSNCRDLIEEAKAIADRMGQPGHFRRLVELKGVIKCDNPLISEVAKQKCVYYSMSVTRQYEETYEETDAQGKVVRKTRKKTDTVASNTQSLPFYVEDNTGKVLVNPNGAELDPVRIIDKFEPGEMTSGRTITFGDVSFSTTGLPFITTHQPPAGHRTLGYNFTESILPLDRKVYVLGEASDADGELVIKVPRDKGRFIISLKSEEELMAASASGIKLANMGMIVSGLLGLGLVVLSIIR